MNSKKANKGSFQKTGVIPMLLTIFMIAQTFAILSWTPGPVHAASNLVPNSGFESPDLSGDGWQWKNFQSTLAISDKESNSGKYSLEVKRKAPNGRIEFQYVNLKPDTEYLFSVWVKRSTGSFDGKILMFQDGNKIEGASYPTIATTKSIGTEWTRVSGTFKMPASPAYDKAWVGFQFMTTSSKPDDSSVYYVDDFIIQEVTAADSGGKEAPAAPSTKETTPSLELSREADIAARLGLLVGDGGGVTKQYLALSPTRIQAAVMFLRLQGLENDAKAYKGNNNFQDAKAAAWAEPILAYIKAHPELGMEGVGDNRFDPNTLITAQAYYKILLEALGYKMGTDFQWADTIDFAVSKGLRKPSATSSFTLNDLAGATVDALQIEIKGKDNTLLELLVQKKVIDEKLAGSI